MDIRKNNKHQRSRCRALDKCFRNRTRRFYIEDLIEACEKALEDEYGEPISVSRRTIINDMNYMESNAGYQADIERIADGKRKYYRYADPNFSIEQTPLTDDVIGVTIPQDTQAEHVLLRFSLARLPYVLSKPLHLSQKTKDREQGIIEITAVHNREMEALLLSFGSDVEVLATATIGATPLPQLERNINKINVC